MLLSNTSKDKKADKQDNLIQALFDYVVEETEVLIISTFKISEIFKTTKTFKLFESVIDKSKTNKPLESIKPISEIIKTSFENIKPSSKEGSFTFLNRQQHKKYLKKKAIKLDEDSDIFMTITKKDRLNSIAFQDRIEMNA